MGCPSCGAENPSGARFCNSCGAPQAAVCPGCGNDNPPGSRFCNACGGPLGAAPSPQAYTPRHLADKILASRSALEGERKQVTVLFADVVGSTELIQGRDAEEAQALLDGVVRVMMDAVHRFEGTVSRLMGDGLMAMFGAPVAHEDHAVRACYAALAMLDGVRRHDEAARRVYGITPTIRVGLSAGEVVVRTIRDDLHMDYTAMGQTVHLAARMEQLAAPGMAALTSETVALVEGYVRVRSLGPVPIKGLPEPVEAFELMGAGQARTRLQVGAVRGLSRFVGRDVEIAALYAALERAGSGQGQVAALVGEPGVGKSRLVWELTHSHWTEGWLVLESGSVSYGKATSYLPVIDLLKAYCRIEAADDARAVREKVTGKLLALDERLRPILPPLLALLDVPPNDPTWEVLDPVGRRQRTLDAVQRLLLRESREQPLLVVFEDLHWIDSETQALLDRLIEGLPTARILLLVNYRPEYTHTWGNRALYSQVRVDPLGEEGAEELLAGLLGGDPSLEPLKALLAERTQGNPLFLEESVRSLAETDALVGERGAYRLPVPLAGLRMPATVQAVLAARIDRLPAEEKSLLQTAAVIGKDVPDALLRAVADRPDDDLRRELATLQAGEFLYEAGLFPELEYTFKHALTHEVAYGSLLHERRKALHARIVEAIERLYPDRIDEQVERLAYHAMRAECWEQAVRYDRSSGRRAVDRSAYHEAVPWLEQALDALSHLPESRQARTLAVDIRLDLRSGLEPLASHGRILERLREAEEIAEALGDEDRLSRVCAQITSALTELSQHQEALAAGQRALRLAERVGDQALQTYVTFHLGRLYRELGQLRQSAETLRSCVEMLASLGDQLPADLTVKHLHSVLAGSLGELGDFDDAIAFGEEGIRRAEAAHSPLRVALACNHLGNVYFGRGAIDTALPLLRRGLEESQAWGLPHILAWSWAQLGAAHAEAGRPTTGVPLLERAVAMISSSGFVAGYPLWAAWLGRAYLAAGRPVDARQTVTAALDFAVMHQELGRQAYLLRALADVEASGEAPDTAEAEAHYREALALAEELGMRPLQAHCHLGLGKLYRRIGRLEEARDALSTAITMLHEMGMAFWLPEAEAELAQV